MTTLSDAELLSKLKTAMRQRKKHRRICAALHEQLDKIVHETKAARAAHFWKRHVRGEMPPRLIYGPLQPYPSMNMAKYWGALRPVILASEDSRQSRKYTRSLQEEWLRRKASKKKD